MQEELAHPQRPSGEREPTVSRGSLRFPKHSFSAVRHVNEYAMNSILVHGHSCGTPIIWNVKLHSMLSLHQ